MKVKRAIFAVVSAAVVLAVVPFATRAQQNKNTMQSHMGQQMMQTDIQRRTTPRMMNNMNQTMKSMNDMMKRMQEIMQKTSSLLMEMHGPNSSENHDHNFDSQLEITVGLDELERLEHGGNAPSATSRNQTRIRMMHGIDDMAKNMDRLMEQMHKLMSNENLMQNPEMRKQMQEMQEHVKSLTNNLERIVKNVENIEQGEQK